MVVIARREVDVRPILGAVVVFLIIGSIIFSIWYFLIAKPAADALEAAKTSATRQINSLAAIGTSQSSSAASTYMAQVQAAGSPSEVDAILVSINLTAQIEQTRKNLLREVNTVTTGSFYSATGASGTIQVSALGDLLNTLKAAINAKQTKSELEAYESEIYGQATSAWREFFTSVLENLGDNISMFRKNSSLSGRYITKDNARTIIAGGTWETLLELKFENKSTVRVPVQDTFQRTPTIRTGSMVNVYIYDTSAKSMSELWANVPVRNVIYSHTDIAAIVWSLTDGETSQSYSVDMWETIKAAAAGDPEAAAVGWSGYGADVMDRALTANIGNYTVSAIYVLEVPDNIGVQIVQYEFHQTTTKDVILIAAV